MDACAKQRLVFVLDQSLVRCSIRCEIFPLGIPVTQRYYIVIDLLRFLGLSLLWQVANYLLIYNIVLFTTIFIAAFIAVYLNSLLYLPSTTITLAIVRIATLPNERLKQRK